MNYSELRILSPELGIFTVTGLEDELKPIQRLSHAKNVSDSTFDKYAYGKPLRQPLRSLQLGRLSLALN